MNYFIEKHDMEIILDGLEALHQVMILQKDMRHNALRGYTIEDVDGLFQSLENSGEEAWDLK